MAKTGTLFLIIGPSGAGKDTLLSGARNLLADDPDVVFTRRIITRPVDPDREDHEPVTAAEFAVRAGTGKFLLHWQAHGYGYGILASAKEDLAEGRRVVANISRTVIAEAVRRYSPVTVIEITAAPAIRAARLATRSGEDASAIEARLSRDVTLPPGITPIRIENDGTKEDGIAAMVEALRG